MGTQPKRDAGSAVAMPIADLVERVGKAGQDSWYGVYMLGRKVGHGRVWLRRAADGEPGAFTTGLDVSLSVEGPGGKRSEMNMAERRFYAGAAPHPLVESHFETRTSGVVDARRAIATPDGVQVTRTLNGAAQPARDLPPTRDRLATLVATMPPDISTLRVGQQSVVWSFDWQHEADERVTVTVDAVKTTTLAGVSSSVATLSLAYERMNLTATTSIAADGSVLRMAVGPTIELRFEEEHVAKSGVQGLDILGSGVRVSRPLGDPSAIDSLAVRVELPDGVVLPSSPNQRIAPDPAGGVRITLQRGPGAQVTEDERADALGKDAIIDWGHEEIGAKAREITAAAKTPRARADAIGTWVYRTLDKRLATHLPSASTVLTRRVGDCTEHAWLFTALARAVGLPTRPVYGLAYAGDKEQTFAYHAWVEVEIDGRWVPVDPTWNERVADATHLKLGSDLAQVGAALGGLTLEVVDP